MDDIPRTARVDVLAAEDDFREAIAFFLRHSIPELTAMNIKENFVAEIRAADTKRNHNVNIIFYMIRKFLQMFQGARAVQMTFLNIRQLAEKDFLRLAIFGKMRTDEALLAHYLHSFMSFFQIFFIKFQICIRNFAFTIQVVIIKRKT